METKICCKCEKEKSIDEFYKYSKNPNKCRSACKACMNTSSKIYNLDNKEKLIKKNKLSYINTKTYVKL